MTTTRGSVSWFQSVSQHKGEAMITVHHRRLGVDGKRTIAVIHHGTRGCCMVCSDTKSAMAYIRSRIKAFMS